MIPGHRQANLLFHLPATVRRQEGNVGGSEGVVGGEEDAAVVATGRVGGVFGTDKVKVPFEEVILWMVRERGW